MIAMNQQNGVLNTAEAARYIGVSPRTLAEWRRTRKPDIPVTRCGRRANYRIADLEAFLAANREQTAGK
jgi:transposase-like protein